MERAVDEVDGAAEAAVDAALHATRIRLVEEIHLERGVDARHLPLARDAARVVARLRAQHAHAVIEMHEVVEVTRAEEEGGREGDLGIKGSLLLECEGPVGKHLRPDAQTLSIREAVQHGIRDIADAELQCGAIEHLRGDEVADLLGDLEMLLLVTERTRHAAATGGNHCHFVASRQLKHLHRRSER